MTREKNRDTLQGLWTELMPLDDAVGIAIDPEYVKDVASGDYSVFNPEGGGLSNANRRALNISCD